MRAVISQFVPVVILGAGVLLISGIREQFDVPATRPMSSLPRVVNGLTGVDRVVSKEEQRVAGMSDYALREYGRDSALLFTTYVGYYNRQVQGQTIHSPKNCMPGAGWDILSSDKAVLDAGAVRGVLNRVVLANKGALAVVLYWYQGRGRIERSEYRVKWDLMRDAALYGRTEEALVRVVLPLDPKETGNPALRDGAIARADSLGMSVARELTLSVASVLPAWPATSQ